MVKLRELVAVEVMGAKVITTIDPVPDGIYVRNGAVYYGNDADRLRCERFVPDKNIADAWRVVEAVKLVYRQGYCSVTVQRTAAGNPEYSYECFICERVYDKETGWATEKHCVIANATTAPLAICLAALRACGVSEERIEQARKEQR